MTVVRARMLITSGCGGVVRSMAACVLMIGARARVMMSVRHVLRRSRVHPNVTAFPATQW